MNDQEISLFIQNIERSTPKEAAIAKFKAFGEVALYANREGYLRIAVEMLKCAISRGNDADLHYLFQDDSDFGIDHLVTSEDELKFVSS